MSVTDDDDVEGAETFTITLTLLASSDDQCQLGDNQATITITDNDIASVVSISGGSVTEGGQLVFTVSRTNGTGTCTVFAETANGTATSPGDFTFGNVTIQFNPGETSIGVLVNTIDDTVDEPDETIFLNLTNPTGGCEIAESSATGTILDNDEPAPPPATLSVSDASVTEGGDLVFTVTRAGDTATACLFGHGTQNGTAIAPGDYAPGGNNAVIAAGATTTTFTVATVDDALDEPTETLLVNIATAPGGCAITDNQGTGTILDNDDPPPPREVCVALDQVKLQAYLQTSTPVQPINLGPGTYNVTLTSSDPTHPDSGDFEQHTEQWFVELVDANGTVIATSGTIGDLPAIEFTMTESVGTITIPDGINASGIRAVHAFPTAAYSQSVYATLACLQLVGHEPEDDI